jgi:hypothetical protein
VTPSLKVVCSNLYSDSRGTAVGIAVNVFLFVSSCPDYFHFALLIKMPIRRFALIGTAIKKKRPIRFCYSDRPNITL